MPRYPWCEGQQCHLWCFSVVLALIRLFMAFFAVGYEAPHKATAGSDGCAGYSINVGGYVFFSVILFIDVPVSLVCWFTFIFVSLSLVIFFCLTYFLWTAVERISELLHSVICSPFPFNSPQLPHRFIPWFSHLTPSPFQPCYVSAHKDCFTCGPFPFISPYMQPFSQSHSLAEVWQCTRKGCVGQNWLWCVVKGEGRQTTAAGTITPNCSWLHSADQYAATVILRRETHQWTKTEQIIQTNTWCTYLRSN